MLGRIIDNPIGVATCTYSADYIVCSIGDDRYIGAQTVSDEHLPVREIIRSIVWRTSERHSRDNIVCGVVDYEQKCS